LPLSLREQQNSIHRYRHKLPLMYQKRDTGATVTVSAQFGDWTNTIEPGLVDGATSTNGDDDGNDDDEKEIRGLLVVLINRAFLHLGESINAKSPNTAKTFETFVRLRFAGRTYDSETVVAVSECITVPDDSNNSRGLGVDTVAIHSSYESAFSIPLFLPFSTTPMATHTDRHLGDATPIALELIDAAVYKEEEEVHKSGDWSGTGTGIFNYNINQNHCTDSTVTNNNDSTRSVNSFEPNDWGSPENACSTNTEVNSNNRNSIIGTTTITIGEVKNCHENTWTGKRKLEIIPENGTKNNERSSARQEGLGRGVLEMQARLYGVTMQKASDHDRSASSSVRQTSLGKKKKKDSKKLSTKPVLNVNTSARTTSPAWLSTSSIAESIPSVGGDDETQKQQQQLYHQCESSIKPSQYSTATTTTTNTTVVRIKVVSVRGLKAKEHLFGFDIPSCYCVLMLNKKKNTANRNGRTSDTYNYDEPVQTDDTMDHPSKDCHFQTSTKYNVVNPIWNEYKDFSLPNNDQDKSLNKRAAFSSGVALGGDIDTDIDVRCELWDKDINLGRILLLGELTISLHKLYNCSVAASRAPPPINDAEAVATSTTITTTTNGNSNNKGNDNNNNNNNNTTPPPPELELEKLNGRPSGIFVSLECSRV